MFLNKELIINIFLSFFFTILATFISNSLAEIKFDLYRNWGADSDLYWNLSTKLLNDFSFQSCNGNLCNFHLAKLPFYPFMLSIFRLFTDSTVAMFLINIVSLFVFLLSLSTLADYLFNKQLIKIFFIFAISISPIFIKALHSYDTDLLSTALIALFSVLIIIVQKNKSALLRFILFASIIFICLTRSNLFIYPLFFLIYLILDNFFKKKIKTVNIISILLIFITIFTWSYRNYLHSNKLTYTSFTGQGLHLHYAYYNLENTDDFMKSVGIDHLSKQKNISLEEAIILRDELLQKRFFYYVKNNVINSIYTALYGIYNLVDKSYYPFYNIIFAKLYNENFLYENAKNSQIDIDQLSENEQLILKIFKKIGIFFQEIFTLIFFSSFIFILFKKKFFHEYLGAIFIATIFFVIVTGITHGSMISDRGFLPVYFTFFLNLIILFKNDYR